MWFYFIGIHVMIRPIWPSSSKSVNVKWSHDFWLLQCSRHTLLLHTKFQSFQVNFLSKSALLTAATPHLTNLYEKRTDARGKLKFFLASRFHLHFLFNPLFSLLLLHPVLISYVISFLCFIFEQHWEVLFQSQIGDKRVKDPSRFLTVNS